MGLLDKLFNREIKDTPTEVPIQENTIDHSGEAFQMYVEDVFSISGRGTVVTGRVFSGTITVGEVVIINGTINSKVLGIEMFRKSLDYAQAGDDCGLLLENISREEIHKGDAITK